MNPLAYARAIIAAVLTTGLVVVVVMREITTGEAIDESVGDGTTTSEGDVFFGQLDATFLMMAVVIVILVVPDTIAYFRKKKGKDDE